MQDVDQEDGAPGAAQTEPTQSASAPSEPARVEPAPTEPVHGEPAPSEAAAPETIPSEAAPTEPAPSESIPAEPTESASAAHEPLPDEPAPTEPAAAAPAADEPLQSDAPPVEPASNDLTSAEPVPAEAEAVEPAPDLPAPDAGSGGEPELATLEALPPRLRQAVAAMGWERLMPVQERALPRLLAGRDVMVQSRTGSGKTGAFLLPILDKIDPNLPACQALVLAPTRELAAQVARDAEAMGSGIGVRCVAVYGGVGYGPQIEAFRQGAHIVVGAPGRILDHLLRGTLSLRDVRFLVFDEADRMLSIGFYPDMKAIQRHLPRELQGCMFSATFPQYVLRLADEFLRQPEFIGMAGPQHHVAETAHYYSVVPPLEKDRALMRYIELENPSSGIIFCNTRSNVHYVTAVLQGFGYDADEISSDLTQGKREATLERVRRGDLRFLVATDVAARGIDIQELSHVFLYDQPEDPESYVHRAGRTGRAGASGVVISLVDVIEELKLQKIAKQFTIPLEKREPPTAEEVQAVAAVRVTALLEAKLRALNSLQTERLRRFEPLAKSLGQADEESALLAMLLDEYYQASLHAPPPQPQAPEPRREPRPRRESRDDRFGRDRREFREERPVREAREDRPPREAREERPARENREGDEDRSAREGREDATSREERGEGGGRRKRRRRDRRRSDEGRRETGETRLEPVTEPSEPAQPELAAEPASLPDDLAPEAGPEPVQALGEEGPPADIAAEGPADGPGEEKKKRRRRRRRRSGRDAVQAQATDQVGGEDEPESDEPESAEPESAEPESAEPESAEPESAEPDDAPAAVSAEVEASDDEAAPLGDAEAAFDEEPAAEEPRPGRSRNRTSSRSRSRGRGRAKGERPAEEAEDRAPVESRPEPRPEPRPEEPAAPPADKLKPKRSIFGLNEPYVADDDEDDDIDL